jgi:hypothetical protein
MSGKATNKRVLYVGGLDETVTDAILHDSFIPFGDIKSVEIPQDYAGKFGMMNIVRGGVR